MTHPIRRVLSLITDAVAIMEPVDLTGTSVGDSAGMHAGVSALAPSLVERLVSRRNAASDLHASSGPNSELSRLPANSVTNSISPIRTGVEDWRGEPDSPQQRPSIYRPERPPTPHPERPKRSKPRARSQHSDDEEDVEEEGENSADVFESTRRRDDVTVFRNPLAEGPNWAESLSAAASKREGWSNKARSSGSLAAAPVEPRGSLRRGSVSKQRRSSNGSVKKEAWHVGSDRGTPTARTSGTTSRLVRSKRSLLSSLEATFNGLTCGLWSHRTSKH